MSMKQFEFQKVNSKHKKTIFSWLDKPHVKEFWDNSTEHREDILIFIDGRIKQSNYFDGSFTYWIGSYDDEPFAFIMTAEILDDEDLPLAWKKHLSKKGETYSIDFCIGNEKYLGKGLAAPTLKAFTKFFKNENKNVDTFFIDPDEDNPKATHVYEKAGFKCVESFLVEKGVFKGQNSWLMVKSN